MKAQGFRFEVRERAGDARVAHLETPHGPIETPAFMPVATYGAVRGLLPDELAAIGARILLANTYHLHERPGEETIRALGGLHGFSGWRGPWLTDSGGFQITSLADRVDVQEDGVRFVSPLDGRTRHLRPEDAVAVQEALGSDVAMVLDECLPSRARRRGGEAVADPARARAAMERTQRWARRCLAARSRPDQALFAIVQGGTEAALRAESAAELASLGFDGYAHGGLGLGEPPALRSEMVAAAQAQLPADAPRYLMGIGRPEDVLAGVAAGVDLFDCVIPTRHGRHGLLYTGEGVIAIRNARYRRDPEPLEAGCDCPACRSVSRAYLAHLVHSGEALGARLASLHNLRFYLRLLEQARSAIAEGRFEALARDLLPRLTQRL